jgi:hypothetical protein
MDNGVTEACWLCQLLQERRSPPSMGYPRLLQQRQRCPHHHVQHQCTKHVAIDLHLIHECVAVGDVRILHVPTTSQFADIFLKIILGVLKVLVQSQHLS